MPATNGAIAGTSRGMTAAITIRITGAGTTGTVTTVAVAMAGITGIGTTAAGVMAAGTTGIRTTMAAGVTVAGTTGITGTSGNVRKGASAPFFFAGACSLQSLIGSTGPAEIPAERRGIADQAGRPGEGEPEACENHDQRRAKSQP